jgi:hypothetical protein
LLDESLQLLPLPTTTIVATTEPEHMSLPTTIPEPTLLPATVVEAAAEVLQAVDRALLFRDQEEATNII